MFVAVGLAGTVLALGAMKFVFWFIDNVWDEFWYGDWIWKMKLKLGMALNEGEKISARWYSERQS